MAKFNARVHVQLKPSVLDPQGKAVEHALATLGFKEAGEVRVGKYFDLAVDAENAEKARTRLDEMAHTLLANPVIERYTVEINSAA